MTHHRAPDPAADPDSRPIRIERWGPRDLLRHLLDAMAIYAEAMGYPAQTGQAHASFTATHTSRPGFRAVAALSGEELVGFAYGYTTLPGQWWHDQVRVSVSGATAAQWLVDCFELCELHVQPDWQGAGTGRALLGTLVEGLPESRIVLSTPEGESRAWRLYRSLGFSDVLRHHFFPGDSRAFAVLGATLPFPPRT